MLSVLKLRFQTLLAASALSATATYADAATECSQHTSVRKIEIVYADKDKKVPCTVKYTKEDQSEKEVAAAKAQTGVCEDKAKALADKLTGMGWTCAEK